MFRAGSMRRVLELSRVPATSTPPVAAAWPGRTHLLYRQRSQAIRRDPTLQAVEEATPR
jgi:hypothetical protein